jgi:DNA-binding transcriptional ArsR family regulator
VTTARDEQRASHADAQAALFASLADARRVGIIRRLGDGDRCAIAQIAAGIGADWGTANEHVRALQRRGVLGAHDDGSFTRYDVKDTRIQQLMELAAEIMSAREVRLEGLLPDPPAMTEQNVTRLA